MKDYRKIRSEVILLQVVRNKRVVGTISARDDVHATRRADRIYKGEWDYMCVLGELEDYYLPIKNEFPIK